MIDAIKEKFQSGCLTDEAQPVQRQRATFPDKETLDRRRFSCYINPVCFTENPVADLLRGNHRERYGRIIADIVGTSSFHKQFPGLSRSRCWVAFSKILIRLTFSRRFLYVYIPLFPRKVILLYS